MLRFKQLVVQDAETIWNAVRSVEASKTDLANCLIARIGAAHECEYTSKARQVCREYWYALDRMMSVAAMKGLERSLLQQRAA